MKTTIAIALMAPTFVCAEFLSGNDLLQRLQSQNIIEQTTALGYVMGVFDASQRSVHCAPDGSGITAGQVRDLARIFLEQNPAQRNQSADVLLMEMLSQIWPCRNGKQRGA